MCLCHLGYGGSRLINRDLIDPVFFELYFVAVHNDPVAHPGFAFFALNAYCCPKGKIKEGIFSTLASDAMDTYFKVEKHGVLSKYPRRDSNPSPVYVLSVVTLPVGLRG